MSKLILRFYSMSSAFQKNYLTASKTHYFFFLFIKIINVLIRICNNPFLCCIKIYDSIQQNILQKYFSILSFNWPIKQFLHILPASVYPFSAQQPGCTWSILPHWFVIFLGGAAFFLHALVIDHQTTITPVFVNCNQWHWAPVVTQILV